MEKQADVTLLLFYIINLLVVTYLTGYVYCLSNDAEVYRMRNLQICRLNSKSSDVIRFRNLQCFKLSSNNANVVRYRNLQFFRMKPLLYEYKIFITNLKITDQHGNPSSSFLGGDVIQLCFTITNVEETESLPLKGGLIATQVQDPNQVTMYLTYAYENLQRGETKDFIYGYKIPNDAPSGTYTVKVMVFTDWPSNGGLGLAIEQTTFNVA